MRTDISAVRSESTMSAALPTTDPVEQKELIALAPDAWESVPSAARALAEMAGPADRLGFAHAVGVCLVSAWWNALVHKHETPVGLRSPLEPLALVDLPASAKSFANRFGEAAARLDVEAAAHRIGMAYTSMLPREHRARLGVYYTPPALAERLIDLASASDVDWAQCRVLDPACGGGAFLAPVARRILGELRDCDPSILIENVANRLRGYEIDPFAAWVSQVALDALLLPLTRETGRRLPVVVTVCDSLRDISPRAEFDLVIGNPPYGRVRLDPADRLRFKRGLFGHANLYGLFTDLALEHVRQGGVLAYVTPTSFLAGEYFKNLRKLLGRNAPPAKLDFVSARKGVFTDVLQETLLATYKKGSRPCLVTVHEIASVKDSELAVERAGAFALPIDPSQPWILPRCAIQAPLVATLSRMKRRLADWGYKVSTGPLVWNRHKDQLSTRPGRNCYPLIWAEAITPDGRFMWRAERRNHTPWFEVRPGDDWLVTDSPCVLLQRTTAKEQNRRLIGAALPAEFLGRYGSVVVENHLNMLRPIGDVPLVPAEVLAAFINSAAADRAFRCVSGSVAVSAYELETLPIPDPEELTELSRLVGDNASRSRIEVECDRLLCGAA